MKSALLFVSPVVPAPSGSGLAMRAHAFLRVLATRYRVFLLVASSPAAAGGRAGLGALCAEIAYVPVGLWSRRHETRRRLLARIPALYRRRFPKPREWASAERAQLAYPFAVRDFERVHVFRLYVVPLLDALATDASWRHAQLDLDELESHTRQRLAPLHAGFGDVGAAARTRIEARQYAVIERARLRAFERVFVCSEVERARLVDAGLHPRPEVAPNVVRLPAESAGAAARVAGSDDACFRFLFVGALGYLPNADAVWQLASRVLPSLRARGLRVGLDVAGAGLPRSLARDLASDADVRVLGFVDDLALAYADADAVVAPIRAGGGTRIKILEAFAHRRPLIATPLAIEGIDARHERHALIGELDESFTAQCERVIREPALGRELARHAFELVRARHSEAVLRAVVVGDEPPAIDERGVDDQGAPASNA